jgi:DnaJ-class molecular chaperone
MYTETCPKCLGYGTVTGLCYKTMRGKTITCKKCKGAKVIHYKSSPELRERTMREKTARRKKAEIPIRWVPPEKIPEEYDYDI